VSWAFTHLCVGSPALLKLNPKAQLCLERRPDDANRFSRESRSQRTILSGVNWYWWLCGSKAIGTRYELIAKIDVIEDIKEVSRNRHGKIFSNSNIFLYPNIGLEVGLAAQ
jgi:hypothetical protein